MNNLTGNKLVKEKLDKFFASKSCLVKVPFLLMEVVCQACLDHDAVFLDTLERKPRDEVRNPRLSFCFEAC